MKIIVLIKEVPDTYGERKLSLETGLVDRASTDAVIDEISERSLEVALTYADSHPDTEVVALLMGPATSDASLRKALAIGAASAVQITDATLAAADLGLTAEVLAAGVKRVGFDLIIAGNRTTDGSGGVIPSMIAELLDLPSATNLDAVEIADGQVTGRRATDGAEVDVHVALPAIISITERLPEARFPSFKGIMSAKKKPLEVLSASDLGINPGDESHARSIIIAVAERPPRAAGVKIEDSGDAGEKLAAFLIENRLA